ncbi:hypothetical protein DFH11DRAFT_1542260 [Phellopilus nigrolimitatus]|nr:hypothetical protein DFH11DRAFT_1542260 [Phellopilus nigrolimitatus]
MAPSLRFQSVERGFAHVAERHSPQAGFSQSRLTGLDARQSAPTLILEKRDTVVGPSGTPVATIPSLTASTKVLTGLIVYLGVIVLGVATWKIRKFLRKRRTSPKSLSLKHLSLCASPLPERIISEKRNPFFTQTIIDLGYDNLQPFAKAHLLPPYPDVDMDVGWIPQIKKRPENLDMDKGAATSFGPDLIPRPFVVSALPPPAVQRGSRISRITAAIMHSPRSAIKSFDTVPPLSSTALAFMPMNGNAPRAAEAMTNAKSSSSPEPLRSKGQRQKQKPAHLPLPVREDAPSAQLPKLPAPKRVPVPIITIAEVTQTILAQAKVTSNLPHSGSLDTETEIVTSPTRMDSVSPVKPMKDTENNETLHHAQRFEDSNSSSAGVTSVGLLQESKPTNVDSPALSTSNIEATVRHMPSTSAGFEARTFGAGSKPVTCNLKLPHLVVVARLSTPSPSMPDELLVRRGEVLHLLREFKDGWCEVQRIGVHDAERGVVPRFCIAGTDRPTRNASSCSNASVNVNAMLGSQVSRSAMHALVCGSSSGTRNSSSSQ